MARRRKLNYRRVGLAIVLLLLVIALSIGLVLHMFGGK